MILVTGGAGFIGSNLVRKLLNEGQRVLVLDNFDSFYSPQIKRKNVKSFISHPKFTLIEGDIRDKNVINGIFQRYQVEKIVHLAARAGVRPSIKDPFIYEKVNVEGTLNLLESCKKYCIKKFVFASSSSVYGNVSTIPFYEDTDRLFPVSPYGVTKLAGELLCRSYHYLYKIPMVCIRIFTAYGPAQRPEMAIHKFTRLIYQGKPVPVFGQGDFKRDYTYIQDLVEGIVSAINYKLDGFEVVNLGSSHPVDLLTVIKIIESSLHKKAKIEYFPPQLCDPPITYASIDKAKKILDYHPRISIEEGIKRFVEWYLENRNWLNQLPVSPS